jgi:hypothetical protein
MENSEYFKIEEDKIIWGLEEANKKLVAFKKQISSSLVVSRNGKVEEIIDRLIELPYIQEEYEDCFEASEGF